MEVVFERNWRASLDPDKPMAGRTAMAHWICPKAQPHLFVASPQKQVVLNRGCSYCASIKACICNSLQSLYPALAAECDTVRNGVGLKQLLRACRFRQGPKK